MRLRLLLRLREFRSVYAKELSDALTSFGWLLRNRKCGWLLEHEL